MGRYSRLLLAPRSHLCPFHSRKIEIVRVILIFQRGSTVVGVARCCRPLLAEATIRIEWKGIAVPDLHLISEHLRLARAIEIPELLQSPCLLMLVPVSGQVLPPASTASTQYILVEILIITPVHPLLLAVLAHLRDRDRSDFKGRRRRLILAVPSAVLLGRRP